MNSSSHLAKLPSEHRKLYMGSIIEVFPRQSCNVLEPNAKCESVIANFWTRVLCNTGDVGYTCLVDVMAMNPSIPKRRAPYFPTFPALYAIISNLLVYETHFLARWIRIISWLQLGVSQSSEIWLQSPLTPSAFLYTVHDHVQQNGVRHTSDTLLFTEISKSAVNVVTDI